MKTKKLTTKLFSIMIALCMLLALVPTTAFAVEGEYTAPSDWVTGTFDGDDSITITYTIPADADYEKLTFLFLILKTMDSLFMMSRVSP